MRRAARVTLEQLRRYAIARSLFTPTTLGRAIRKLGFVQADPIRAPARAQDLTLRHRVLDYRAGDLERRYPRLPLEEDYFVNYGYLLREHHHLMHPRTPRSAWSSSRQARAQALLAFVVERGTAHPRAVDQHFAHGKITNWFGGSTNATTRLLDEMHYRGLLRVARRDAGTRVYAPRQAPSAAPLDAATVSARVDALVDLMVQTYAPLPARSLSQLLYYLSGGVPQWSQHRAAALERAARRLGRGRIEGVEWYWPAAESPGSRRWRSEERVRLLTPFDPVVWDRRRFQLFWGWQYRFEAYTPAPRRKLGYYALPLLWGERVIGWGNLGMSGGSLASAFGYVDGGSPRSAAYRSALELELGRMRAFLGE
ncbi:MAG TPA: crosslink repair DNA glycosylase YcaQ family protein [Steroidobacteraceae bacterium]|nr:crosslink repair DNA glycosylase YcaQ family protein [Steroidobacteraceae bacterium]